MTLAPLPSLLRGDRDLTDLLGSRSALLAVAEPARAFVLAALARVTGRRPIVVITPTTTDAERIANDMRAYLGDHEVDVFPAWETLPFERVSPSVETMGRRLRAMWHLRSQEGGPAALVIPVKSVLQRLGPHVEETAPVVVRAGQQLDAEALVAELVGLGYRREYQVEHRGEIAVRGSIVDVFPSTAEIPVRIDLWGDEVDRLSEFSVQDQRSTDDIAEVELFGCRELRPTPEVRARAEAMMTTESWGRDQWDRLAQGLVFDGMESWLPWLTEGEHVLMDLVPTDALVVLVEPRRMRDRAADLLDEEAALAGSLAMTWGADKTSSVLAATGAFPRLHLPFDRLLAHTAAPVWTMTAAPEGPSTTVIQSMGWTPVMGDSSGLVAQLQRLLADGYRVILAADTEGSADRLQVVLRDEGLQVSVVPAGYEPDIDKDRKSVV